MIGRRPLLAGLAAGLAGLATELAARPAAAADRVIERRLELWRAYAGNTRNLVASLTTTRHSSIFAESAPLVLPGTLVFVAPGRLLLHDEDPRPGIAHGEPPGGPMRSRARGAPRIRRCSDL